MSGGVHFPNSTGFDYEVAYAAYDNVSFYSALQFDRGPEGSWGPPDSGEHNNRFFEIGVGYFDSLGSASWQTESFLHIGVGSGYARHFPPWRYGSTSTDTTYLSVARLGLQQTIGTEGNFGAFGIGLGLGFEHFFNLQNSVTKWTIPDSGQYYVKSHTFETSAVSSFYAQPVIFWRLGYKGVKLMQEVWYTLRPKRSKLWGDGNESLTLSFVF